MYKILLAETGNPTSTNLFQDSKSTSITQFGSYLLQVRVGSSKDVEIDPASTSFDYLSETVGSRIF
jgi:hypothetical protein